MYKENWNETKDRYTKWWNCEETDRPLMIVTAPKDKSVDKSEINPLTRWQEGGQSQEISKVNVNVQKTDWEKQWTDVPFIFEKEEEKFSKIAYLGEAYPYVRAYLGPGSLGAFLGSKPGFGKDTIWYEPCYDSIENVNINLDKLSKWYRWSIKTTKVALERAKDKYIVAMPDLIENLDTIVELFGTENMLYYLIDNPNEVHRIQKQILPLWFEAFNEHFELIKDERGGNAFTAFGIWGPGKTAKVQCDFSAMISPEMYDEFVYPYLKQQCDGLDYSLYHLDGASAICHLDTVLKINSLKGLQWSPGASQPDGGDPCWDEIYKKALNAGKCIHAQMHASKVKDFIKRFGKKGVLIATSTPTVEEGLELIEQAKQW